MSKEQLTTVALPLMLSFIMFSLGLGLSLTDFKRIARSPKPFLLGVLSHFVLLPLTCFLLLLVFPLPGVLAVGFMLIAACPTGTTSNLLTYLAKGDVALALSFTAAASIITIFTLPIILAFSMSYFLGAGQTIDFPVGFVAIQIFFLLGVPVGLGMFVKSRFPAWTARFESVATKISTLCFILIVLAAVAKSWDMLTANFSKVAPMALALNLMMLTAGFLVARLGQLNRKQSITLGIETGMQNATLAIVIATSILGNAEMSIPGAIYGLVMYAGGAIFVILVRSSSKNTQGTLEEVQP